MTAAPPNIHASRCVRFRYRYSDCDRCQAACPHQAVTLSDEGVAIDASRCRHCALCATACPTDTLMAPNLRRVDLLKGGIGRERYAIACTPSGLAGDATVPCLGALDGAMLAYLAKRGIRVELRGASYCDDCEHGQPGAAHLAAHLDERATLERACGGESWAETAASELAPAASTREHRAERRQLFRRFLGRGVNEVFVAPPPVDMPVVDKGIRPGSWHVPEMRELLKIVCRRTEDAACLIEAPGTLPLADIRLAPGCTRCEACTRACPTGALQSRETESDWMLLFQSDRCVGCDLCLEICQPRVLRRTEPVDATPERLPLALHTLAKQRCKVCDRFFVSPQPEDVCSICRDDDDAFGQIYSQGG